MNISWSLAANQEDSKIATVLIHGFGGSKEHWRHNQHILANISSCYAIDLIGFGSSSQPKSKLKSDHEDHDGFEYCFEAWAQQIYDFCISLIKKPVILIGNSIGGVVALRASQLLSEQCSKVILINCAQRTMDDKRLYDQPIIMQYIRPYLKKIVSQRFLSKALLKNAANENVIKKILYKAYPSKENIDKELIQILLKPSKREGAEEAFRGFINLFDDYLAPELMMNLEVPVYMIWGEDDPWEPLEEAQRWASSFKCIKSLETIKGAGHCPHDEKPDEVNKLLLKIIQEAI